MAVRKAKKRYIRSVLTERRKTQYPDEMKIASILAVRASGGNITKVAADMNIPYGTLRTWVRGDRCRLAMMYCDANQGDMTRAYRDMAWMSLGVATGKMYDATFRELMTGSAIAFDKMRILEGLSTSNSQSTNLNVNLSNLTADERRVLAELLRKSNDAGVQPNPVIGTGPTQLPGVPDPVVPGPGAERPDAVLG